MSTYKNCTLDILYGWDPKEDNDEEGFLLFETAEQATIDAKNNKIEPLDIKIWVIYRITLPNGSSITSDKQDVQYSEEIMSGKKQS